MISPLSLGTRLRRAREDAGKQQREAAEAVGVHEVTLSKYENDKRPAPPEVRRKLAELYGLPAAAFDGDGLAVQPPQPGALFASRELAIHWRGQLVAELRHMRNTVRTMEALLGSFDESTGAIGDFVDSGVLPMPDDGLTPEERQRMAEVREMIRRRQLEEANARTPQQAEAAGA